MILILRRRRSWVGSVAVGLSSDAIGAFLDQRSKTQLLAGKPAVVPDEYRPSKVYSTPCGKKMDVCGFGDATVEQYQYATSTLPVLYRYSDRYAAASRIFFTARGCLHE